MKEIQIQMNGSLQTSHNLGDSVLAFGFAAESVSDAAQVIIKISIEGRSNTPHFDLTKSAKQQSPLKSRYDTY
jgi:hypothetical protein